DAQTAAGQPLTGIGENFPQQHVARCDIAFQPPAVILAPVVNSDATGQGDGLLEGCAVLQIKAAQNLFPAGNTLPRESGAQIAKIFIGFAVDPSPIAAKARDLSSPPSITQFCAEADAAAGYIE